MIKKTPLVAVAVAAIIAVAIEPIGAVTDGELDGNRHPYVGLIQSAFGKHLP